MISAKYCKCGGNMIVLETRDCGDYIRRRRECDCCGKRITTKEKYEGETNDNKRDRKSS